MDGASAIAGLVGLVGLVGPVLQATLQIRTIFEEYSTAKELINWVPEACRKRVSEPN
jgi:hypothetical protein